MVHVKLIETMYQAPSLPTLKAQTFSLNLVNNPVSDKVRLLATGCSPAACYN